MEIIYLIIALAIGFIVAWLISSSKIKGLSNENSKLIERSSSLEKDKEKQSDELKSERGKVIELNGSLSSLKSDYSNLQQKLTEQKGEIEKLQETFTKEFENLANKIFEEKGKAFTETNKTNLAQILDPLKERIKDFEKKVDNVYIADSKERAGLIQQIKTLHELNQQMSRDATNLTNALKGQSKTQGNWGEFILESILEKSGLKRDREFTIQESLISEDGKRLQPDIIIKLPENKSIIIDSKVSLNAYERYFSTEEEEEKKRALQDHIISLRAHIKNLSSKKYQDMYQLQTLDFVIMFIPIESALALAVQNDSNLFAYAFEQRILTLSPSILLASLKIFASIWQQEKQNQNAMEIAKQSGALYDKFVGFVEDLKSIGDRIDQSKTSYESAMSKLKLGSGNLVGRAEKIKQLGAKATKTLPPSILNRAIEDSEE